MSVEGPPLTLPEQSLVSQVCDDRPEPPSTWECTCEPQHVWDLTPTSEGKSYATVYYFNNSTSFKHFLSETVYEAYLMAF